MIESMKDKIQKEMDDEANHKAYCDKEISDTTKSQQSKTATVDKLKTRIDTQTSQSLSLREQVAQLQKELLSIMQTQKEMDRMRKEEHARYKGTKPELVQGIEGIKKALKVLRKYYSQDKEKEPDPTSAGSQIIGILEVVESDISKGIANLDEQEASSQTQYEDKTKEIKSLSKVTSESSSDLDGVQAELDAVNEYFSKIQEECIGRPDAYEERLKRQTTTMTGLKDALQTLQGRASLAQQGTRKLRGVTPHQPGEVDETNPAEGLQ